jgi:hypothetical protein
VQKNTAVLDVEGSKYLVADDSSSDNANQSQPLKTGPTVVDVEPSCCED